jgi:hypothetical protein
MEITPTEVITAALILIAALAFYAFTDSSGQSPKDEEEGPQILDEDDFNGD